MSSSLSGVLISAFLFGVGEGMSTGLRDLNKKDYRNSSGPLGNSSRLFVAGKLRSHGYERNNEILYNSVLEKKAAAVRRMVQGLSSPWASWCGVLNSISVGIIGRFLGMRCASLTYAIVAVFAAYISIAVIPNSKPPFIAGESDIPLWTSWWCCNKKSERKRSVSYVVLQPLQKTNYSIQE
jgi:hypothetical protein